MSGIEILGENYNLQIVNRSADPGMIGDGYCDPTIKKICVCDMQDAHSPDTKKDLSEYQAAVIRHEIIHAFLYESGLDSESWARNEEIVDWFALQYPKISRAISQAEIACGRCGDLDLYKLP